MTAAYPLSKCVDPVPDYAELTPELATVDRFFTAASEQHSGRRWEYALALRALTAWTSTRAPHEHLHLIDVGGAGSPFALMADHQLRQVAVEHHIRHLQVTIIDPAWSGLLLGPAAEAGATIQPVPLDLATYLTGDAPATLAHICTVLSVVEHVPDLERFLFHLSCLVLPGGLLFLTMDCCEADAPDPGGWPTDRYHFHWMRQRIFDRPQWQRLRDVFARYQFRLSGEADWAWKGAHVADYSFCSLALVKRV